jgi:hypothetical protein
MVNASNATFVLLVSQNKRAQMVVKIPPSAEHNQLSFLLSRALCSFAAWSSIDEFQQLLMSF